jgi:ribonuclease BN (tRNA processing enzyme)
VSARAGADAMKVTVIGSGDAFGSGGRLQAAYLVEAGGVPVLVDCGATTTLGFNAMGRNPEVVEMIVISHLHGDHFAGLVWWFIHAVFVSRRTAPLKIYGPPGIEERFNLAAEVLYTGSTKISRRFALTFEEVVPGASARIGHLETRVFVVDHPSGAASYALRFAHGGKTLAFTGDSGWTEAIVTAGTGADLYIMECYKYEVVLKNHMAWKTIQANLDRIGAKRVMLTHMSDDMLARRGEVKDPRIILAEDGLVVDV